MTYNANFVTLATAIKGLTITGIPIRDITEIPSSGMLQCPVLIPKPDGYISNLLVTRDTYGTGGTEKLTLTYDLTYRLLYAPIGMNLDFGTYDNFISAIASILVVLETNDVLSGAVDIRVNTVSGIGPVNDPAGNVYHGCDFVLSVTQLCEV
jgi:hypothetical protein